MTTLQKWFVIIAMWVGIVFLIFVFYWLAIRPAAVRKMCSHRARILCEGAKSSFASMLEINRAIYSDCLRSNGIDK